MLESRPEVRHQLAAERMAALREAAMVAPAGPIRRALRSLVARPMAGTPAAPETARSPRQSRTHLPTITRLALALAMVAVLAAAVASHASAGRATSRVAAPSTATALAPASLVKAQRIRARVEARYRALPGGGLAVTEASSTGIVESFALLTPDLLGTRFFSAANGIYYAICPVGATCPYPARRLARPAADIAPRRLALELALHTFLETSADVVAVSLPTSPFVLFVVERRELEREVALASVAKSLGGSASPAFSPSLARIVDRLTRPRVFVITGLEPTPNGRDSLAGIPRWPAVSRSAAGDHAVAAATR